MLLMNSDVGVQLQDLEEYSVYGLQHMDGMCSPRAWEEMEKMVD